MGKAVTNSRFQSRGNRSHTTKGLGNISNPSKGEPLVGHKTLHFLGRGYRSRGLETRSDIPFTHMSEKLVITFHWENEQRSVCMSYTEYATLIHPKCGEMEKSVSLHGHYTGPFVKGVWLYAKIEGLTKLTSIPIEQPRSMTFNCAGCMWKTYALQNLSRSTSEPVFKRECDMCLWRTTYVK